jgi:ADP-ribosyl-[dinitrogen reductase] hydrolase
VPLDHEEPADEPKTAGRASSSSTPEGPLALAIANGSWRGKPRVAIRSSGYVIDSLEAALWAVNRTATFADAVLTAANLGGDADTTAAIAGQLAGARYGLSGIPQHWLDKLAWRERIEQVAWTLFNGKSGKDEVAVPPSR